MASEYTKLCFVTVGATASFEALLFSVLDESFLSALRSFGYTHLLIQYGKDGRAIFEEFVNNDNSPRAQTQDHHGIQIDGFDFNQTGLTEEMRLAKENPTEHRKSGMIVSHAGEDSSSDFTYSHSNYSVDANFVIQRLGKYTRSASARHTACGCPKSNSEG